MKPFLGPPYQSYVYAYPHKTAYRPLVPPRALSDVWQAEDKRALFLYVHVPFCEMRCGFCNLFTARSQGELVAPYLSSLRRQAARVREALGATARISRFAVGGGTPTLLAPDELRDLLCVAQDEMGASIASAATSVETSPETVDRDRLDVLRAFGVDRISIGVQSFDDTETRAIGRPQEKVTVDRALELIRGTGFPTLNIDLIYGIPGQSTSTFGRSLERAVGYRAEEIYLYPLYVRPLTGLGRRARTWDDQRLSLYRFGRDFLRERGYVQTSMRMFRAAHAPQIHGPVYCVQDDGMVGLGCGARSYTRDLHYGSQYAVSAHGVRGILDEWLARPEEAFGTADHGFVLDEAEQRRRYVALTLLGEGLPLAGYSARFGTEPLSDLPLLVELVELGLAHTTADVVKLTDAGVERSDAIGPALASPEVTAKMESHELR